jgi:transposase-like protein
MGYSPELKAQAVQMHLEGMSFRAVGRVLGVNFQSVVNWFNHAHDQLPHQVEDPTPTETLEVDELSTYVGKKEASVRCGGSRPGYSTGGGVLRHARAEPESHAGVY